MSFFSAPQKTKRTLMFHVGSGSVIAAHVLLEPCAEGVIPQIENSVVVPLPIPTELDGATLVLAMRRALKKSAELMVAEKIGSPDEIICFLESPWYASQVRNIRIAKNVPFLVTEKLINSLLKKEIELFDREELAQYRASGNESVIIERELGALRLNGYYTTEPYGKKASEIELSVVISFSPRALISEITQEISAIFHRTDIQFRTFAFAGSAVVQDLFISHDQFLFADVGAEMTDIVLVRDSVYREAVSFPFGTHTLLRIAATKLGVSIDVAQTLVSLYSTGKLESMQAVKIERILEPAVKEWTKSFEIALEKLASKFAIPNTIALITDPVLLPLFKQAILNESFAQHLLSTESFGVVPLSEVPWHTFARHSVPTHPRSSIGALLVAKYMSSNK